jgi:hypothetical protein
VGVAPEQQGRVAVGREKGCSCSVHSKGSAFEDRSDVLTDGAVCKL